jgi:predicted phosphohydrolase
MRIKQLSDLHLECNYPGEYFDPGEGDVLILAGDILNVKHFKTDGYYNDIYRKFLDDCSKNFQEVLYVAGNHEFYSYTYEKTHTKLREILPDNIHFLQNDVFEIGGIYFIGFTFWTNYFNENPIEMWDSKNYMNDYKAIRIGPNYRKIQPYDILDEHKKHLRFLNEKLELLKNERIFVISHHSPTLQSIAEQYKTSQCNGSFCSDYDELIISNPQIKNWAFGHVHTAFDFYNESCRMTCNPRGRRWESTGFNKNFTIEIP